MPIKSEKERRNSIKRDLKKKELETILNALPISLSILQDLFDRLDSKLSENPCDNTLLFALEFIDEYKLPEKELVEWLRENGGYCDCEVLANVDGTINDS